MIVALKPGVRLGGLRPEMATGLIVIASVFDAKGVPLTVTSGLDGEHKAHSPRHPRSLHYEGLALDLRLPSRHTGHVQCDAEMKANLQQALGSEFDVVLEGDHLHCEFDPKEPAA
jgi:hypothetical protein